MTRLKNWMSLVLTIVLAYFMIKGGVAKFIGSSHHKHQDHHEEVVKTEAEVAKKAEYTEMKKKYIGGLKATNYMWHLLGVIELLGGLLILYRPLALTGALILMPITINIFLFHLFLEPNEIGELILTALLLLINLQILWNRRDLLMPVVWAK